MILSSPDIATPPSGNAPDDASLNAADRLAIVDLFEVYVQDYDAGNPGEFLSMLTDTVELTYLVGGKVGAEGMAQVT